MTLPGPKRIRADSQYLSRRTPARNPPSALVADNTTGLGILPYRVARPSLVLGFVAIPTTVGYPKKSSPWLASVLQLMDGVLTVYLSLQGRVEHVEHVSDGQRLRIPATATCPGFPGHIRSPGRWDSNFHHSHVVACAI
jgi:hypothetical protein